MCGIIFTTKQILDLKKIIKYSKYRGPDKLNYINYKGYNFIHQLLHITGEKTLQPFIKNNIVCIFNGEIYNYKNFGNYKSDGCCLIDLYLKFGIDFIKKLDGEYAIILLDINKNILIFSTDVFSTKPLYYSIKNNELGIATYKSNLITLKHDNILKLKANTTIIYNINSSNLIKKKVYEFNLRQYKTTLNDIFYALEQAILKRCKNLNKNFYLGLSSGYDSGTIAACLNKYNIEYTIYTIECREDINTLIKRHKLHKGDKYYLKNNINKFNNTKLFVKKKMEKYQYKNRNMDVSDDKGTIGVSIMAEHAKKKNIKICISGQGPDEIMSDYAMDNKPIFGNSPINTHTCFNGKFPENLKDIFPWKNFFGNSQEDYLMKEELANGLYSIEGRYPFLDVNFVQEFLNLSNELKNKEYKYVLKKYMENENYPYIEKFKVGFTANHKLSNDNTDWITIK